MTGYGDDVARYFTAVAERRQASVAAAAAKIDQVAAAGDRTAAETEQQAQETVAQAAQAVGAEAATGDGERAPGGWPASEPDSADRVLGALSGFDEADERGDWRH